MIVQPRPDEFPFPVREAEFQILCEGETSEARLSRERYIGACVGALVGLASVLATTDWATIWQPGRRGWFVFFLVLLFGIVIGSVVGICIHQARLKRTLSNSAYSRLTAMMSQCFQGRS
jgi:hypothetical protein